MKKIIYLAIIFTTFCGLLSAQNGTVTIEELTGSVQIQVPGGTWTDAFKGQEVDTGTMISTGFRSTAKLNTGSAEIMVEQLTRLTIEELVSDGDSVTTSLFLNGGRINAEVSREDVRQDFTVRSSVATASVRGTGFSFDGRRLDVSHGAVLMQSGGRSVLAFRGDHIRTDGETHPQTRLSALIEQKKVSATLILEDSDELEQLLSDIKDEKTIEEYTPDPDELRVDLSITIE